MILLEQSNPVLTMSTTKVLLLISVYLPQVSYALKFLQTVKSL
jgi:hypothetical protein